MSFLIDIYFLATGASNAFQLNELVCSIIDGYYHTLLLKNLRKKSKNDCMNKEETILLRLVCIYIYMYVCHLLMCMRAGKVCTNNNF